MSNRLSLLSLIPPLPPPLRYFEEDHKRKRAQSVGHPVVQIVRPARHEALMEFIAVAIGARKDERPEKRIILQPSDLILIIKCAVTEPAEDKENAKMRDLIQRNGKINRGNGFDR